jgi:hypothetical protein
VESVTLVDLDPAVIELASSEPVITELNGGSFEDPRVEVVNADAFQWLRENRGDFDVIVADLPDGQDVGPSKLYSVEFYSLARHSLADDGRMVVQAGSPFFAPDAYWSVGRSLQEAGLPGTPYNVDVPSFGNWGFYLTSVRGAPVLEIPDDAPPLRFLDEPLLDAAQVFPRDRREDTEGLATRLLELGEDVTAELETVDGVPAGYLEGGRRFMTEEQYVEWESGVKGLYDQMVVIRVTPTWVKLLDFETTIPQAVEELVRAKATGD